MVAGQLEVIRTPITYVGALRLVTIWEATMQAVRRDFDEQLSGY
jgi:hypothetical protein